MPVRGLLGGKTPPAAFATLSLLPVTAHVSVVERGRIGVGGEQWLHVYEPVHVRCHGGGVRSPYPGAQSLLHHPERLMVAPKQMSDLEAGSVIQALVHEINAQTMKDMGRVMAALKERYAGKLDFTKASAAVKKALTGG